MTRTVPARGFVKSALPEEANAVYDRIDGVDQAAVEEGAASASAPPAGRASKITAETTAHLGPFHLHLHKLLAI